MKKFLTITFAVIAALMLTACSGKSLDDLIEVPDQDNTADSSDTSDKTDTDQGGDTNADTSDSNADTGDTNADTADSNTESGDSTADTGDTNTDTGDTNTDTGDSDDAEISDSDISDNDESDSDNDSSDSDNDGDPADSGNDADSTDSGNDSDNDSADSGSDGDPADSGNDADSTDSGNDSDNDSADSDNDSDPADSGNDNDADNPETPESDCVGISIDWNTFVYDAYRGAYYADVTGKPDDTLMMAFSHNDNGKVNIGEYHLDTEENKQYSTCTECVRFSQDCEYEDGFYPVCKEFFQKEGTLTITANDDSTYKEGNIEGTISATLVEAYEDGEAEDYTIIPIENGDCIEIQSGGTFKSTLDCLEITLDTDKKLTYNSGRNRYETSYTPRTGSWGDIFGDSSAKDYFTMQLRNFSSVENYSLAGTNYSDSTGIFFVIYEDSGAKYYFQKKGTINYNASTKKVQLTGVMLEAVTINGSTNKSTRIPYGACLKVTDTTLSY